MLRVVVPHPPTKGVRVQVAVQHASVAVLSACQSDARRPGRFDVRDLYDVIPARECITMGLRQQLLRVKM